MLLRSDGYPSETNVSIESIAASPSVALIRKEKYRCSICHFQSRPAKTVPTGFMEVVSINGRERVLCALCAQSTLLRRLPDGKRNHGQIFYCPSITQGQVSNLCRYIGLHIVRQSDMENSARNFVRKIKDELVPQAEKIIPGFDSGDPFAFADLMDNLQNPSPKSGLDNLRYWPNPAVFNYIFQFWDVAYFSKSNLGMTPT